MNSLCPLRARKLVFYVLLWICLISAIVANEATVEGDQEPLPDPNDENYAGMIYIGRMHEDGKRMGFDVDNGMLYMQYVVVCYLHNSNCSIAGITNRDKIHLRHWIR
jgi:hypothetical protein